MPALKAVEGRLAVELYDWIEASTKSTCVLFAGTAPQAPRNTSRAKLEPHFGTCSQVTLVSSGLRSTLYQQSEVPHLGRGPVQPSGGLVSVVRRAIEDVVAEAEPRRLS